MKTLISSILSLFFLQLSFAQNKKEQIEVLNMQIDSCKSVIANKEIELKTIHDKLAVIEEQFKVEKQNSSTKSTRIQALENQVRNLQFKLDSTIKANEVIISLGSLTKDFHFKINNNEFCEGEFCTVLGKQISYDEFSLTFPCNATIDCVCGDVTYYFKRIENKIELIKIESEIELALNEKSEDKPNESEYANSFVFKNNGEVIESFEISSEIHFCGFNGLFPSGEYQFIR